jgi:hypothetical protein
LVVVDRARSAGDPKDAQIGYARRLRLALAAEHLDREPGPSGSLLDSVRDCADPAGMFTAFGDSATRLDAWHDGGRVGPRPRGRLRRISPPQLSPLARTLALGPYLVLHDPDGRPRPLRRTDDF